MILSAATLRTLRPVEPFDERGQAFGMSYGLSVCGYDIRSGDDVPLMPGDFALVNSLETFNMPLDVVGFVHDKSTLARSGIAVQNTVIEPGWRGILMLELTNHHRTNGLVIKRGMPIAQIVFHRVDQATEGYDGKYQDQKRGQGPLFV